MRFHKLSVFAAYKITFISGEIGILSRDDELLTIPLEGGQKHFLILQLFESLCMLYVFL